MVILSPVLPSNFVAEPRRSDLVGGLSLARVWDLPAIPSATQFTQCELQADLP